MPTSLLPSPAWQQYVGQNETHCPCQSCFDWWCDSQGYARHDAGSPADLDAPDPRPRLAPPRTRNQRVAAGFPRLTGNELRLTSPPPPAAAPRRSTVQTANGLVLASNVRRAEGRGRDLEYFHRRHLVELDPDAYECGRYALPGNTRADYLGRLLLRSDLSAFTDGQFDGEFFCSNTHWVGPLTDADAIPLDGGGFAHLGDEHRQLAAGPYMLPGMWDYESLIRVPVSLHEMLWCAPEEAVTGIVDRDGTPGLLHPSRAIAFGPGRQYCLPEVMSANGIAWSDHTGGYWLLADAGFYHSTRRNAPYHSQERPFRFNPDTRFTVGFEVEKEDRTAVLIPYGPLYARTGWCKERDGSLDEYSGYELISPAFDLFTDELDDELDGDAHLRQLINADYSRACGGHINFGMVGRTGFHLIDLVAGYLPLIYAMFPGRARGVHTTYATARKKDELRDECEDAHRVSVKVHDNRIEFRVFGAVRDVRNLLWRRDLLRCMATSLSLDAETVLARVLDGDTDLHRVLSRVYSPARLLALVGRAVEIHAYIEEEDLDVTLQLTNLTPVAAGHAYLVA